MNWSLPAFAVRRPVTMSMVMLSLLCLGVIAFSMTPLEYAPRFDFPVLLCVIDYPNAAPRQVEKEIALPAEGEFKTLSDLERVTSYSDTNGCRVVLRYKWDVDMGLATAELRDRIERLKLKLPDDVERVIVRKFSFEQAPIMRLAIFRDEDQEGLAHLSRTVIKSRLMRIDGVAEVEVAGHELKEIFIEFDQSTLHAFGLDFFTVVQQLQQSNINISAGNIRDANRKYFVRCQGEFHSTKEIEELIISDQGLRLKELAEVFLRPPEELSKYYIDQTQGVFISVRREAEANTVDTCKAILAELEDMKKEPAFKGADFFVFEDRGDVIQFAIGTLMKAGRWGALLAFLILFVSLGRITPTLVVGFATPASLVVAFIFLYFNGQSINLVTMAAMLVSVGMLVDNSIVVIENIERHKKLGRSALESAERGAAEVALAITAATATTIVVFLPLLYIQANEMSVYMREFAGPLTLALLASLFFALTILPLAESRLLQWMPASPAQGRFSATLERAGNLIRRLNPVDALRGHYRVLLRFVLTRRTLTLAMLAMLLFVTYWIPYKSVGMRNMPVVDQRVVKIRFRTDPNYGRERVEKDVKTLEAWLWAMQEELGIENIYLHQWGTGAELLAFLVREPELEGTDQLPYLTGEVQKIIAAYLPKNIPGGSIKCGISNAGLSGAKKITVRMQGDDTEVLLGLAENFMEQMEINLPELENVELDRTEIQPELRLQVDMERAAAAGISPFNIAKTVEAALRGHRVPPLKMDEREVWAWAQFRQEDRESLESLDNIGINTQREGMLPLRQLTHLSQDVAPTRIIREDGKTVITLIAMTREQNISRVEGRLLALANEFRLPRGYALFLGDEFTALQENKQSFGSTLLLAIILIYLVMAALFESPFLPLSILTTVVLAFVGVYWSMYLTSTPMDTVAFIGAILICGIIVNNGIVIVDHINQLRRGGMKRFEALMQAGEDRFRPVMMTSLTTVLGSLPLAIGGGENAGALESLGRAFVGGLTAGTLLTLVIVPVAYTLVDDLQHWCGAFICNIASSSGKSSSREL